MYSNYMKMMRKIIFCIAAAVLVTAAGPLTLRGEEVLTWRDCTLKAIENHPDLQSSKEKIRQAQATEGITRSTLLPQIDANASVEKSKNASRIPSTSSGTTETYTYGITGKQLLFDGTKSIYDLKSSKKQVEAADYDFRVTSSNVRLSLRNAFIQLLKAQESLTLTKDIAKIRKQNYELVRMRYKAGVEHRGSLLTAEANLAQAEFEASQAGRNVSLYQHGLIKEMGLKEFIPVRVMGELAVAESQREKPDLKELAGANPTVLKIVRQRESAKYGLIAANTDNAPKIYGELSADKTGTKWPPDNNEYSVGVTASLNLFQGGKSYYTSEKAEATLKQLEADERSTRNTVLQTLEQKWTALQNTVDIAGVQKKYLDAYIERAAIADAQYSIGTIVFDNWIIIQDALVSAKKSYLEAEISALTSEAEWIQAKGGTLGYEE